MSSYRFAAQLLLAAFTNFCAFAQVPGANQHAADLARKSPIAQSSYQFLLNQAQKIADPKLHKETLDAIENTGTCIHHRVNLTEADRAGILRHLIDAGLIDTKDDATFPGGLKAGVFPAVIDDGGPCPNLPQPFIAAPGSSFGGHHSYPGGLAVHETVNEISALNLAGNYRHVYGHSTDGFATLNQDPLGDSAESRHTDIFIDQDIMIAAPIWHDWAKTIVFQWNADGSELPELNFGGNGATDNYGAQGNSKTGAHHILGLAEAMKRGLSPAFVITQASAHSAPSLGNEYKVVNWLRAAAIIAGVDPVRNSYLAVNAQGQLHLPMLRKAMGTSLLPEYALHNLSDADYTFSIPAEASAEEILKQLAPALGFNPSDTANYNLRYRNPALSFITAERLMMIAHEKGPEAVKVELLKLKTAGVIGVH